MKMILAATAIALTMVTTAHAGSGPNGYSINGLAWNGVYENGLALKGRTSTGARPEAFAGQRAIGSADLIAIELPR